MLNKLKYFKYIYLVLASIIVLTALLLPACNKEKLYQNVTLEVYHPVTGEIVAKGRDYKFEYDGNPKMFTAKVKLNNTDRFLDNGDFDNQDWKSHVKLYVMTEDDDAYKDWKVVDGKNVVLDWLKEADWPTERGRYEVELAFNNHGFLNDVENDNKYAPCWANFSIVIV